MAISYSTPADKRICGLSSPLKKMAWIFSDQLYILPHSVDRLQVTHGAAHNVNTVYASLSREQP